MQVYRQVRNTNNRILVKEVYKDKRKDMEEKETVETSSTRMRISSFFIACFVIGIIFITGLSGVASAFHAGVIPHADLIQSYTSSGGTPEYKDSNTDLVYKVQQRDTLTFSITLNPGYTNLECEWTVRKGSAVLTSATGTSFSWTVPSEDSTWEIEAEVFLRDAVGNPVGKDTVSWSITTVDVVTVNPGESIQNAIDSLTNGGIVELKAGDWDISTPIRIRANNITFRGQGIGVTRIHVTTEDADGIVIGKWDDWRGRSQDMYHDDFTWRPYSTKFSIDHEDHPEHWTDNTVIKFLTIDGLSTPDWFPYAGIGGVQLWNTYISDVEIIGDSCSDSVLIVLSAAVFPTVKDCELKYGGRGALFEVGSGGIKVINNLFYHNTFYHGLGLNGGLCCGDNLVKGNQFINGGGILIYSAGNVAVTENLLENGHGHHGGIISMLSNDIIISRNIVKNSNYELGAIRVSWAFYGGDINITITNNLVYNNRDHGIFIDVDNRDQNHWANLYLTLTSNTIVGNQKSGIFFGTDRDTPLADATLRSHLRINSVIRNNIVVNNGEAGMNSAQNIVVDENGVKTVTGQDLSLIHI